MVHFKKYALLLIGAAVLVAISYNLGQKTAKNEPPAAPAAAPATITKPSDLDGATSAAPEFGSNQIANSKLMHFRVGNRNVKSMYADGKIIWIGTSGGVVRYDTAADDYKLYDNKTAGLLSNGIFHVSKLGDKIVVGSYGGGLSVYTPQTDKWQNYNIPQGLADQFVYDVVKAKNGDIWVATWSGANRIKEGKWDDPAAWETFTVENTKSGLPNPWVYGIEEGKNGDIWFATEAGLARYQDGKWQNWQHKDGLGAPLEVVKDDIQFTNDPGKSSKHHAQQKAEQGLQDVNVAYNPNYIISLKVDDEGVVWCGTWGGGLARFDGKTWQNITTKNGLPGNHIFMLYLDPKNQLWAGTSKGLVNINRQSLAVTTELTIKDGLYADNVFSMTNADDGSIWVGSFGGVARLQPPQIKSEP